MTHAQLNESLKVAFQADWFVNDNNPNYQGLTLVHKQIDGLKAFVSYRVVGSWRSDKSMVSVTLSDWQGYRTYDKRSCPPYVHRKMNTPRQTINFNTFAKEATAKMIEAHNANVKFVKDRTALNNAVSAWQNDTIAYLNANANGVYDKYATASRWVNTATIADIKFNYDAKKVTAFVKVDLPTASKIVDLIAHDAPVKINEWSTAYSNLEVKYVFGGADKKADISFSCSKETAVKIFHLI